MASLSVASRSAVATASRPALRAKHNLQLAGVGVQRPSARHVRMQATPTEDPSAKLQEQFNEAVAFVKTKWEETDDSEKPAAIAIIISVVVAQIAIGATIDAVHRLPFIHEFLEFVGLAVVGVYGYRYVVDPDERESLKKGIDGFVSNVTGKQTKA